MLEVGNGTTQQGDAGKHQDAADFRKKIRQGDDDLGGPSLRGAQKESKLGRCLCAEHIRENVAANLPGKIGIMLRKTKKAL